MSLMQMMPIAAVNSHSFFFLLFALVACAFALGVLFSSNIVRMAFYLVLSLGATAGLFFLAGAQFVGAMQLLIYVGGTLVLLVFGVMLTAQSRFVSMKTSSADWVLAAFVAGSLLILLLRVGFSVEQWRTPYVEPPEVAAREAEVTTQIGGAFVGLRVDQLEEPNEVLRGGMAGYLLPFVAVAVHLLVVMVGAAYLARPKKRLAPRVASDSNQA